MARSGKPPVRTHFALRELAATAVVAAAVAVELVAGGSNVVKLGVVEAADVEEVVGMGRAVVVAAGEVVLVVEEAVGSDRIVAAVPTGEAVGGTSLDLAAAVAVVEQR